MRVVTTVTPMKRGLKDLFHPPPFLYGFVTTVTPMKRGLKDGDTGGSMRLVSGVTTVTPMKRGLKATSTNRSDCGSNGYNHFPDEKGTESSYPVHLIILLISGYNHFPDEKGTESSQEPRGSIRLAKLQPLPR